MPTNQRRWNKPRPQFVDDIIYVENPPKIYKQTPSSNKYSGNLCYTTRSKICRIYRSYKWISNEWKKKTHSTFITTCKKSKQKTEASWAWKASPSTPKVPWRGFLDNTSRWCLPAPLQLTTRGISGLSERAHDLISGSSPLNPLGQPGGAGCGVAMRSEGKLGIQWPAGIHNLKNILSFKIIQTIWNIFV